MIFLTRFVTTLKKLTLGFYLLISIALIFGCWLFFPERLASLLAMLNRFFLATVYVYALYHASELDQQTKPYLIAAALIASGMAL